MAIMICHLTGNHTLGRVKGEREKSETKKRYYTRRGELGEYW